LLKTLQALGCLQFNIIAVDFPKAISLGANSHNQEVDWNIVFAAQSEIFLHQRDNHLGFLSDRKAILWVVKPLVVGVQMHLCVLCFFITVSQSGVRTTMSDALPLAVDGELLP